MKKSSSSRSSLSGRHADKRAAGDGHIFCVGNALVDLFAHLNKGDLKRFQISQPVQHIGIEKALEIASFALPQATLVSGGGAANAAKIAGFLGASVSFAGAIGGEGEERLDRFGSLFREELEEAGVTLYLAPKPYPSGLCMYLRAPEDAAIVASPSASRHLTKSDIPEERLKEASVLVIDGYMLAGNSTLVDHLFHLAGNEKIPVALDLGSAFIAEKYAPEIVRYAEKCPLLLFMNEKEAAHFKRAASDTLFEDLCGPGESTVIVVKKGPLGAEYFADGGAFKAETEAASPAESTGAGDAFLAGFLAAWVRGKPVAEAAAMGNKTARLVLNSIGTKVDGEIFRALCD